MSGNTIGNNFKVTTYGESHGLGIGCIVDGCPPGLALTLDDIKSELKRRSPGQNKYVSQRKEADEVEILSGVFEGRTTGTPIGMLIRNTNQKAKDYRDLKDKFRPGHGDYVYQKKYGIRDYLGGGRSSARETVARVAAGAIAKKYLLDKYSIKFKAYLTKIGNIQAKNYNLQQDNDFNFVDPDQVEYLEKLISKLRKQGDSIGAKIELVIDNVPVGLGDPVFDKIDAQLAYAMMGINAVKAVEIGSGVNCVTMQGSQFRDEITPDGFMSNHAGGILAGISSGQQIVVNLSLKPAASIRIPAKTIDINGNTDIIVTNGRHDPCVAIRAVPIVESMGALVIIDFLIRQRGQNGNI